MKKTLNFMGHIFKPIEYDDVFDENGDGVYCDMCGAEMTYKDGQYSCSECWRTMDRNSFFDYIGASPPGPECASCDNLYPGCIICPYGYVNDD